jgi:anti-sigma B factor antagonist
VNIAALSDAQGASTLRVTGEVDVAVADELREAGERVVEQAPGDRLDLDLAGVTFMDSSGLGAMVAIRNAALAAGGELRIVACSSRVLELLTLTDLAAAFGLEP